MNSSGDITRWVVPSKGHGHEQHQHIAGLTTSVDAIFAEGWTECDLHDAILTVCLSNFINRLLEDHGVKGSPAVLAERGQALHDGSVAVAPERLQPKATLNRTCPALLHEIVRKRRARDVAAQRTMACRQKPFTWARSACVRQRTDPTKK